MSARASARTAAATSAPSPQRLAGTSPSSISASYFAATPAVMSVRMMPGRTSKTAMPSAASRAAKPCTAMARPAFDTQYSTRLSDTISAEHEETKISARPFLRPCRQHPPGDRLGEEERAAQVDAEDRVEVLRRGLHEVQPLRRRDAGIGDQHVDRPERCLDRIEDAGMVLDRVDPAGDIDGAAAVLR